MSEPQVEVLREVSVSIPMPTNICIGDPLYFECYADDTKKLERLTYSKKFRRPNWLGKAKVVEELFFRMKSWKNNR